MHQPNIRLYLILSGILVIILVAIFIIPLGRRGVNQPPGETVPTPTSIATAPIDEHGSTVATVDFTGVAEEELPDNVAEQTSQKQDLRYRTPLTLSTFVIDFDYNQDKFTVALNEPKDQSRQEFNDWKNANYPAIPADQFIFN